jgi:hypothetical protein
LGRWPRLLEEVEVGACVGLEDVFGVEAAPAAGRCRRGVGRGFGAAAAEFFGGDEEVDAAGDVEFDEVAVADRNYGAASGGFWDAVEDHGAVGGAAHAAVGDADHVPHALAGQ